MSSCTRTCTVQYGSTEVLSYFRTKVLTILDVRKLMILPYFLFPYCTSGNNILALGHMFCPDGLELSLCVIKTTNGNIIRKYFRKYLRRYLRTTVVQYCTKVRVQVHRVDFTLYVLCSTHTATEHTTSCTTGYLLKFRH